MAFDAAAAFEGPQVVSTNPLGLQALGVKIQSLEKGVEHIKNNSEKLGTPADGVTFRRKIVGQIEKAVGLTEEIELGLRRAAAAASATQDKAITRALAQLHERYRAVQTLLVETVRASQRLQHEYDPVDVQAPPEAPRRTQRLQGTQQQQQQVVIELRGFTEVDAAIIEVSHHVTRSCVALSTALPRPPQERNVEALAIATEAKELHGMFKDLAVLVSEQSKKLDVVEAQAGVWPPCDCAAPLPHASLFPTLG